MAVARATAALNMASFGDFMIKFISVLKLDWKR
jgi:hypothetical protein